MHAVTLASHSDAPDRRFDRAAALQRAGAMDAAEAMLRNLLAIEPAHPRAASLLAVLLRDQGRIEAAVEVADRAHAATGDAGRRTWHLQFVADCRRQFRALRMCERQLAGTPNDASLLARAGMLAEETGRFDLAREYFLRALDANVDLDAFAIPLGLAHTQRYTDAFHPDFALFRRLLRSHPSARARTATLFAFGKACDDIGDLAAAASAFRQAHRIERSRRPWSAAAWRARVAAIVGDARALPRLAPQDGPMPVFIVGMPRTGTTLLAERLGRHPQIRDRGEPPLLDVIARRLDQGGLRTDRAALREASALYRAHMRQDDAPKDCYVDKNPLNFRHLGLMAQLLPNARIVHCVRDPRDTALSLWMQYFADAEYGFAHDFTDIATFADGHWRLLSHATRNGALPVLRVDYEGLVDEPAQVLRHVLDFLGLAPHDLCSLPAPTDTAISSASRWQARQPVYRRSIGRWRAYAELVPELSAMR